MRKLIRMPGARRPDHQRRLSSIYEKLLYSVFFVWQYSAIIASGIWPKPFPTVNPKVRHVHANFQEEKHRVLRRTHRLLSKSWRWERINFEGIPITDPRSAPSKITGIAWSPIRTENDGGQECGTDSPFPDGIYSDAIDGDQGTHTYQRVVTSVSIAKGTTITPLLHRGSSKRILGYDGSDQRLALYAKRSCREMHTSVLSNTYLLTTYLGKLLVWDKGLALGTSFGTVISFWSNEYQVYKNKSATQDLPWCKTSELKCTLATGGAEMKWKYTSTPEVFTAHPLRIRHSHLSLSFLRP